MSYPQIRINKTKEVQKTLDSLKERYRLLSEADIVKMLLSEVYYEQKNRNKFRASSFDTEPQDLLMQASRAFGVSQKDKEPDNIAKPCRIKNLKY